MYSKQNYNYGRHGRKRKLKPIPVIITLLIVILILGGIYFLLFNGKNNPDTQHFPIPRATTAA